MDEEVRAWLELAERAHRPTVTERPVSRLHTLTSRHPVAAVCAGPGLGVSYDWDCIRANAVATRVYR